MAKVKIGDHIYLPPPRFPSDRQFHGGKATISKITSSYGATFVEVVELPEHSFNLDLLLPFQETLEEQFGKEMVRLPEVKQTLKGKMQVALVALEDVLFYAPSLLSDLDESDLAQSKKALKRMQKKL
jgi:hypothetical protein